MKKNNIYNIDEEDLSDEQKNALSLLVSGENVFLTGGAGSGKSYVVRSFLKNQSTKDFPVLASTGAAAVLVGGRTFHSFFGLGIMEGGPEATYDRALKDSRMMKRLREIEGIVIDEISMIPGSAFSVAEKLAKKARNNALPWGGIRVIAVGDFFQLPPISNSNRRRDWCFQTDSWRSSGFLTQALSLNQRVNEVEFISILNKVRIGRIDQSVIGFLNEHQKTHDESAAGTRLFPRRDQAEQFNQKKLKEIPQEEITIDSIYFGEQKYVEILQKSAPVPPLLKIKLGCEVLMIQNDPQKRWVNGTRGYVEDVKPDKITVRKDGGRSVTVEKSEFVYQDADGNALAALIQFPLVLGYASTIHKSQGATLDELWCDLGALWEPGHAYVALSRLRSRRGLNILRWSPSSIKTDPAVLEFLLDF